MRDRILNEALPGENVNRALQKWRALPDQPWRFWQSQGEIWAVYLPLGERLADVTIESIKKCHSLDLKPLIVAAENAELYAVSQQYLKLKCHLACDICGKGTLIPPPRGVKLEKGQKAQQTRIPRPVLKELAESDTLPKILRNAVNRTHKAHKKLRKRINDDREQDLLRSFTSTVMRNIGFNSGRLRAADILRRIELAHWNGKRDHFFHSFQNYFIGLLAVSKLKQVFEGCQQVTGLSWVLDPYSVWFLAALYHDVGYGTQRFEDIASEIFGMDNSSQVSTFTFSQFLGDPVTQMALREISSLSCRLLCLRPASSTWMPPTLATRRSPEERRIEKALVASVGEGHGAASALLMYRDFIPSINRMGPDKRDRLKQTVLMACCSMPFHDWRFREALRSELGSCQMPTGAMPYAVTLAFVDSIQEDCRDLDDIKANIRFLEKLVVKSGLRVSAKVNMGALDPEDVLWKIVEARDVLATMLVRPGTLSFIYPAWMVS